MVLIAFIIAYPRSMLMVLVFENGVIRRIWGPVYDNNEGTWCRRHNHELRQLSKLPLITSVIKSQRLRWAGHVARMEEDRIARKVMFGRPDGRRPVGRPRMRWSDNKDIIKLGVDGLGDWWDVALDRGRWRLLVVVAKGHRSLRPAE